MVSEQHSPSKENADDWELNRYKICDAVAVQKEGSSDMQIMDNNTELNMQQALKNVVQDENKSSGSVLVKVEHPEYQAMKDTLNICKSAKTSLSKDCLVLLCRV